MKTDLEKLLKSIDQEKTTNQVSQRLDDAMNSFKQEFGVIKDWATFKLYLIKFYRHTED